MAFAISSTRREDEITPPVVADLEEANSCIMVHDIQNPGDEIGNDVWCN